MDKQGILERLSKLIMGTCSCQTKTPELRFHDENCQYRLASEVAEMVMDESPEPWPPWIVTKLTSFKYKLIKECPYIVVQHDGKVQRFHDFEEVMQHRGHLYKHYIGHEIYARIPKSVMSTVSKEIADKIIAGNGMYPGDHIRVIKIYTYENAFDGSLAYKLIYENKSRPEYQFTETDFVRNPKVYWEYNEQRGSEKVAA